MKLMRQTIMRTVASLLMVGVFSVGVLAVQPFELVETEHDGDKYYVEKTGRFDLEKPLGVALALGGGGARAIVNVGVLKALEEENIPVDLVIGTSMGAIVAVLYGSGMPVEQIEELLTGVNLPGMFYMNVPFTKSLVSTTEVNHFIEKVVPFQKMEDFPIPTALLSQDLTHGVRYIATTGKVAEAVGGPYAIPLCFPGEQVGDSFLIDAGVLELTPAEASRVLGARVVIATTALDELPFKTYDSSLKSWARLINIIKEENAVRIVEQYADVVIDHEVGDYSFMDFHLAKSFIDLGYQQTKKKIPEIKQILRERGIALRSPAEKYAVPMANVLRDVKHDRQVLDTLVVKPVFFYGKDHGLNTQSLVQTPLYSPQFGLEAEYRNFSGKFLTQGGKLDNLETELRWKKILPSLDVEARTQISAGQTDWQVGVKYYAPHYVLGTGFNRLNDSNYLHIHNQYNFASGKIAFNGETDLLADVANLADFNRHMLVSANEAKYSISRNLSLHPLVVWNRGESPNVPAIYRGNGQKPLPEMQAALELVYEQHFRYSLELVQLIQVIGVEYKAFFDYQLADSSAYAVGAGFSTDVNLLGIKPSRLGAYLSNEPFNGSWKFGLDIDVTF